MSRADETRPSAVLLAGPTASGKSALAMRIARRMGATVVNADSMQVYADLRVLTARPGADDEASVPHALYGHVDGGRRHSTGTWLREVIALAATRRPLVIVGGTGLYFRALERGIADIPPVPIALSNDWRGRSLTDDERHRLLSERDPELAARLDPSDAQRVLRGIEVFEATGRPLSEWQRGAAGPALGGWAVHRLVLEPPRDALRARIAERLGAMIELGAADEVAGLLARDLDPSLPVMKAIGVRELGAVVAGEASVGEAVERIVVSTRQYAKRQSTWFRNQMGPDWARHAEAGEAYDAFERWWNGRHAVSP